MEPVGSLHFGSHAEFNTHTHTYIYICVCAHLFDWEDGFWNSLFLMVQLKPCCISHSIIFLWNFQNTSGQQDDWTVVQASAKDLTLLDIKRCWLECPREIIYELVDWLRTIGAYTTSFIEDDSPWDWEAIFKQYFMRWRVFKMALMGNASINGGFSIATFDFQSTQTDTQNKKKTSFCSHGPFECSRNAGPQTLEFPRPPKKKDYRRVLEDPQLGAYCSQNPFV